MNRSKTKRTMKEEPEIKKCFIRHPSYSQPANLKSRIICQLISSVKGRVKMYSHKDSDDCVVFDGTRAEEAEIQYLTDIHVSGFWERVETLYKQYIEEHDLYCKEESEHPRIHEVITTPLMTDIKLQLHKK